MDAAAFTTSERAASTNTRNKRFQRRPQLVRRFFCYDDQGISDFDVRFGELALFHYFGFGEHIQQLATRSWRQVAISEAY